MCGIVLLTKGRAKVNLTKKAIVEPCLFLWMTKEEALKSGNEVKAEKG